MPIYIYKCSHHKSNFLFEKFIKESDYNDKMPCPKCNKAAVRYYHQQSVSGFNGPTRGGKKM